MSVTALLLIGSILWLRDLVYRLPFHDFPIWIQVEGPETEIEAIDAAHIRFFGWFGHWSLEPANHNFPMRASPFCLIGPALSLLRSRILSLEPLAGHGNNCRLSSRASLGHWGRTPVLLNATRQKRRPYY